VANDITGTQLSDANRAGYTGSAVSSMTLKSANLTWTSDAAVERKPIINTLTDSTTSQVSKKNSTVKIDFVMQKRITTAGWSVNDVYQLSRLEQTHGLKLLYVDGTSDTNKTVIEALGAINTNGTFASGSPTDDNGTVSTTTPYLMGRVRNFTMRDTPTGDYWRISFDFVVSA